VKNTTTQSAANLLTKLRAEGRRIRLDRDCRGFKVSGALSDETHSSIWHLRDEIIALLFQEKLSKRKLKKAA
jgi:hypothetical protein